MFIVCLGILFSGCEKDLSNEELTDLKPSSSQSKALYENNKPDEQTLIKLGKKLINPYSVKNMQIAFNYYNSVVLDSRFIDKQVVATHQYIQILPSKLSHLTELDLLDKSDVVNTPVLQDYPMDYEILQEGDYYVKPSSSEDLFHPIYSVIPIGYHFKSNVPYIVLEDIYQPTDDEYDVETVSLFFANWIEDLEADNIFLTMESLPEYLNTPPEIENRSIRKFYPNGVITVRNTDSNIFDPLMKEKISYGRSFWWHSVYTSDLGVFLANNSYRGKVRIRAKWRGETATIRKAWNEVLGIQVSDHLMTVSKHNNGLVKNIDYSWSENEGHLWYKGTVHNGIRKYVDYCNANGIQYTISDANVWVSAKGGNSGATPMLYKYPFLTNMSNITGIGESSLWNVLAVNVTNEFIGLLPHHLRPDQIYKGLRNGASAGNTVSMHQLVFHESGHYSHACKAGATFWSNIYASELANSAATINFNNQPQDPYRNGTQPSIQSGQRIALAEGWATLAEYKITTSYYGKAKIIGVFKNTNFITGDVPFDNITDIMENYSVFDTPTSPINNNERMGWFLHGIMWDILDSRDEIRDFTGVSLSRRNNSFGISLNDIKDKVFFNNNENDLTPVFNILTSDVQNANDIRYALIANHPNFIIGINDLFTSYGY